jgi:SPP1 family predicted phage head-tail adaptor
MRSGRLRHRLAIYDVKLSGGVPSTETLTLLGTFPCEIAPMSGKEYQGLGGTANILTHKITMRYIDNLTTAHIGIYEGRRFRFTAIINPDERKRELQIVAVESK